MMKNFVYFLVLIVFFSCNIQKSSGQFDVFKKKGTDEVIFKVSEEASEKIVADIKTLPQNTKFAVKFFFRNRGGNQEVTRLGELLSQTINLILTNKLEKSSYIIFRPEGIDSILDREGAKTFLESQDESQNNRWIQFLMSKKPDYFIVGEYNLESNYLILKSIRICVNPYGNKKGNDAAISKLFKIKVSEESRKKLKELDEPIKEVIPLEYHTFVENWKKGNSQNVFKLVDYSTKKEVDFLKIGKSYQLSVTPQGEEYIYALFYDPKDKKMPYFTTIFPFSNKELEKTFNKQVFLPEGASFDMIAESTESGGYAHMWVIASRVRLVLSFEQKIENGYISTKVTKESCKIFSNELSNNKKNIRIQYKSVRIH